MVAHLATNGIAGVELSVLALSSRFDGQCWPDPTPTSFPLSVLALSSRFDGRKRTSVTLLSVETFSTRSVESF